MYVPKSSTSGTKSNGVLPDLGTAPGAGADSSGVAVFVDVFRSKGMQKDRQHLDCLLREGLFRKTRWGSICFGSALMCLSMNSNTSSDWLSNLVSN